MHTATTANTKIDVHVYVNGYIHIYAVLVTIRAKLYLLTIVT